MAARPKARSRGGSVGQSIGGALVGFDEQVFGRQPPGGEVHERIDRIHTVSAATGLTIELPPEEVPGGTPGATPAGSAAGVPDKADR